MIASFSSLTLFPNLCKSYSSYHFVITHGGFLLVHTPNLVERLKPRMCKTLRSSLTFPSNSLMLFLLVSLFNELYCHPKVQLANYCEGSRFVWMLQKWWSIYLSIFKMLQHFETFLSTFPPKCTNCIILYVSRSSNIKIISHVTFFYPLWVPIYIYNIFIYFYFLVLVKRSYIW
jgi:hypothetical protein